MASDASSNFVWPPTIYAAAALAAGFLAWLIPLPILPQTGGWLLRGLGAIIFLGGLALAMMARQKFVAAGTSVRPTEPTTAIVETGIYSRTRNPMYLGLSIMLVGLAPAVGSAWFVIALPFAVLAVTKLAIEREEHYLEVKFGEIYRAYKARVPRWFGPF